MRTQRETLGFGQQFVEIEPNYDLHDKLLVRVLNDNSQEAETARIILNKKLVESGMDPKTVRLANKRSETGLFEESRRLRDQVFDMRQELRAARAETEDAVEELDAAKERLTKRDASQARVRKLEQERLQLISEREKLRIENDHLSSERDAAQEEISLLQSHCLALENELDRLVAANSTAALIEKVVSGQADGQIAVDNAEQVTSEAWGSPADCQPDDLDKQITSIETVKRNVKVDGVSIYSLPSATSPGQSPSEHARYSYNDGGRADAGWRGAAGDCVVRAIAIASGLPYKEIYEALSKGCRTQRKTKRSTIKVSARDGVNTGRKWFKVYMRSLGFEWHATMTVGSGCKVHLKADELPTGHLVVALSRHYVAMIDGVINDVYDPSRLGKRCVYGYWKRADVAPAQGKPKADRQSFSNFVSEMVAKGGQRGALDGDERTQIKALPTNVKEILEEALLGAMVSGRGNAEDTARRKIKQRINEMRNTLEELEKEFTF